MSRSFHIVPDHQTPSGPTIQLGMASMLAHRYLDGDDQALHGLVLDHHAKPWLEGVRDAMGSGKPIGEDAELLLTLLDQHGRIRIEVEP